MGKNGKGKGKSKKTPEGLLVRLCKEYNLTPAQAKGIIVELQVDPFTPKQDIAKQIGVAYKTYWMWHNQTEKYLAALHEATRYSIKSEWPIIIKKIITKAEEGDLKSAQWLAELAGYTDPRSSWGGSNEVNVNVSSNGHLSEEERKELEGYVKEIRRFKADIRGKRERATSTN